MAERDPEEGLDENDPPDRGFDQPDNGRWRGFAKYLQRRKPTAQAPTYLSSDDDSDSASDERFRQEDHFVTSSDTYSSSYESSDYDDDTSEYSGKVDREGRDDPEATSSSAGSDGKDADHQTSEVKSNFFNLIETKDITKLKNFLDKLGRREKEDLCQATNESGLTALHLAASLGVLEMCQLLHKSGADINCGPENEERKTPICLAAEKKSKPHWECIDWILKERKASHSQIEAIKSVNQGSSEKKLDSSMASDMVSAKEMEELTKSSWAKEKHKQLCDFSKRDKAKDLLEDLPEPLVKMILNKRDERGNRSIHYAAQRGETDLCRLFFRHGAKLHTKGQEKLMPSEFAARYGSQEDAPTIWESIKWITEERRDRIRGQRKEFRRRKMSMKKKEKTRVTMRKERTGRRKRT